MESLAIVVLAAGKGTRMGLALPKVLVETSEGAMIHHVLRTAASVCPEKIIVVTGYQKELVEEEIAKRSSAFGYDSIPIEYAFQKEQ
ncbi:MAG: NTP transferase domain-containing protein, partial [Bdellovibrionales bacterium]|nr:NTP transferase domain-containing protein [Bdellovibrionales bacterium]